MSAGTKKNIMTVTSNLIPIEFNRFLDYNTFSKLNFILSSKAKLHVYNIALQEP